MTENDIPDDVETFIEKHGVATLFDFLPHLMAYLEGETNAGIVANKLDVEPIEAEIVLQYLRKRVLEE